jgi:membrane associated rhomboid family serine protease
VESTWSLLVARAAFRLPSFRSLSAALAVAVVVVSVLAAVFRPLFGLLALQPADVLGSFFAWQLLTFGLLEVSPMGVIFGALITWSIGGSLESMWGRARFARFCGGIVLGAGVATVLLAWVLPSLVGSVYAGGGALTASLWVAYGLTLGRNQTNFWGMPVTGDILALIGAGFVFLGAAFGGLSPVLPDLFALLFTFLVVRVGLSPGFWWTRLRAWQLERDLKKRSSHLRSLDGGKGGGGSDKYLH